LIEEEEAMVIEANTKGSRDLPKNGRR